MLTLNATPVELTLHATLIVGLSQMLGSLMRSSSSALLAWYPLALGGSLSSTPGCCFGRQSRRILSPLNPAGLPLQAHYPWWRPLVHFDWCCVACRFVVQSSSVPYHGAPFVANTMVVHYVSSLVMSRPASVYRGM